MESHLLHEREQEAEQLTNTLFIVGPGGIGKSPLDRALKTDVGRIDPYRLRRDGPRNNRDMFYAHPRLREELYSTYQRLGLTAQQLTDTIHWFPTASTLFLKVRDEWQLVMFGSLTAGIAKAEIFAPAIPVMFENPQVRRWFGRVSMVILNPAAPLDTLDNLDPVKEMTQINCRLRGDSPESIRQRVASIDEEAGAWRKMITLGATEYAHWKFAEHVYQGKEKEVLIEARKTLIDRCPGLEIFFKTVAEIRGDG